MSEIEKRELFDQQRKIFEAGAQRVDKRAGSFSFLTWPFFIAPLIAGEEFLAATFNSAAAEEDAKAALAGASQQAANDDPPARDPSKTSTEDEMAEGPAASSEAHAVQSRSDRASGGAAGRRAQAERRPQRKRSCRRRNGWGRGRRRGR